MSAVSQMEKTRELKTEEQEEGRGRRDGEREQAAEHPSQKERGLWGCSRGYRAKPGSVERQSEGGGGQREREREDEKGKELKTKEEEKIRE